MGPAGPAILCGWDVLALNRLENSNHRHPALAGRSTAINYSYEMVLGEAGHSLTGKYNYYFIKD